MAGPTIRIVIDAVADGLEKAAKKAGDTVDKLGAKLDKTGKSKFGQLGDAASDLAKNRLGPLGDALSSVGVDLDGLAGPQMAAAAGIAALGTAAVASVKQFVDLADRVRKFSLSTGVGAEDASRLIAVMDDLGVSTDSGSSAIGRLARNIDAGKLDAYGISIARAKDGTVDMSATLANVADAIANTTDPTKRATMGNDLLGKSYAELLPLLNLGADGIKKWTSEVSGAQVLSEQNVAAAQQLTLAFDDLKESGSDLGLTLGVALTPLLAQTAKDVSSLTSVISGSTNSHSKLGAALQLIAAHQLPLYGRALRNSAQNAEESKAKVKALADKHDTAAQAAKAQAEAEAKAAREMRGAAEAAAAERGALDRLDRKQNDMIDAALGFGGAQRAEWRAAQDMKKALDELANGTGDYGERLVDAEDAVESYVEKSWAMYELQGKLAGVTYTAADKANFFRDKMADLIKDVQDPNVRAALMDTSRLISGVADSSNGAAGSLEAFRRQIRELGYSNLLASYAELGIEPPANLVAAANSGRAAGGPVMAGQPYTVGETGPELFVPQSNGRILSADDLARVGGGGGQGVTIVVNSPIGKPDDVVRWMREELRRLDRGQR